MVSDFASQGILVVLNGSANRDPIETDMQKHPSILEKLAELYFGISQLFSKGPAVLKISTDTLSGPALLEVESKMVGYLFYWLKIVIEHI